jgi:hypothetical protein
MNEDEDDEPQISVFATWDDAQVIAEYLHGERKATARVELERRKRFENAWLGEWHAGPPEESIAPRRAWQKPIKPVEILDGRLNRCQREFIPHNPKEREQAFIVRLSKLSDSELRMIAMENSSPMVKAARHVLKWRNSQK